MKAIKIKILFVLAMIAGYVNAQTVESVDVKERTSYEQKSYIYKTGVTLKPGFTFNAQTQGTFFAKYDDFLNQTESVGYGINPDGSPKEISSSKSYADGFGTTLQSQTKSYVSNHVFAAESIYDSEGKLALSTLPAPINSTSFLYRHKFTTNSSGNKYSALDFDQSGNINSPNAVVGNGFGTLGWYYSSSNNLEPLTATTSFPYSRSWAQSTPDPKVAKAAGPGTAHKMGSGHEITSEKFTFTKSELAHYYQLHNHFASYPESLGANLISNSDASSTTGFTANQSVTIASVTINGQNYVKVSTSQTSSTPGTFPIEGNITVTPGAVYKFKLKGYRGTSSNAYLYVKNVTNNSNLVWTGALLPQGSSNEAWVESTFTVPAGCTAISVGVLWTGLSSGTQEFYINALSLSQVIDDTNLVYGYKLLSTDADGKKTMSFVDSDGKALASALVISVNGTAPNQTFSYDYWSYTYYNQSGQVVAEVAPKGIINGDPSYPQFVTTYKYDHLGRLIETTSPDEGTSRFVYSKDGKIRFSQNQEQYNASPKRFSYGNYDYLGRLIEVGEYSCQPGALIFEPQTTQTPAGNSILPYVDINGFDNNISQKWSSHSAYIADYSFIEYDIPATGFPGGGTQENLRGQVSKTENQNSATWYSYDEFGQVIKTWQRIKIASPQAVKTVEYTYDYLGNVTEVAYQKGQTDAFYHHYTYDNDQRLDEVWTSTNGINKTLRAKYKYYLHGPLKRVELGGNLQGIDYTYKIDGALKSINDGDPGFDPGNDGGTDAFGETLSYFHGDYPSSGYFPNTPDQFGGLLKGVSWHSASGDHRRDAYSYTYDSRNQLTNAVYGIINPDAQIFFPAGDIFREGVTSYDKNGNIGGIQRYGKTANNLANYSYVYEAYTNKLDKVNHDASTMIDYSYNAIGQMIQQNDASTSKVFNVSYDAYGLVKEVRNGNQLVQAYTYDDRGNLLQKVSYDSESTAKYNTYISDAAGNAMAIYESATTTLSVWPLEVPVYGAGRIAMYKPIGSRFFYEVSDHLGNVRAVIGDPAVLSYAANFETTTNGNFQNYSRHNDDLVDHTDAATTYQFTQLLNGGVNGRVGVAKSFAVSPGDKVKIQAYAKYRNPTGTSNGTSFITALAGAFNVGSGSVGEQLKMYNGLNYYAGTVPGGDHSNDNEQAPKCFVNVLLFDKNYNFLDAGWTQITSNSEQTSPTVKTPPIHDFLSVEKTVLEAGYAVVFVSNEHYNYVDVYFDDVLVTHTQSPIVAGADYYPFGLAMENREITDEAYRYGYQGQFSEKDATTGQQEFELRNYDPRIGRWLSPDPYGQYFSPYLAMGNRPHMQVDPNGGFSGPCPPDCTPTINIPVAAGPSSTVFLSLEQTLTVSDILGPAGSTLANPIDSWLPTAEVSAGMLSSGIPTFKTILHANLGGGFIGEGLDGRLYSMVPSMSGNKWYAAHNGKWEPFHHEGLAQERYAKNLLTFHQSLAVVNATLVSAGIGGAGMGVEVFGSRWGMIPMRGGVMNPYQIHFMQSNARNITGNYTVLENASALRAGTLDPEILTIKIWRDFNGKTWTLDHRRLAAFRLSGKNVPVEWANPLDIRLNSWKMSTPNGGVSLKLKLGDGKSMIVE